MFKRIALATGLTFAAGPATAASIQFDFSNGSVGSVSSGVYSASVSGLGVTATGYSGLVNSTITYGTTAPVTRSTGSNGGLGIDSNGDLTGNNVDAGANPTPSGPIFGEGIRFSFGSHLVELVEIVFTDWDGDDDYNLAFDTGAAPGTYTLLNADPGGESGTTLVVTLSYTGSEFLIAAVDDTDTTAVDNFKVKSIKVNDLGLIPTNVPEPATLALLGAGLLGLGLTRRRRA